MVKILWTDCEEHLSISVLYIFSYEIFYNSILYPSTGLVQESVNTKTMGSLRKLCYIQKYLYSHSFYDLIEVSTDSSPIFCMLHIYQALRDLILTMKTQKYCEFFNYWRLNMF